MMGYGKPDQITHGIHQRLRARAFIFAERPCDEGIQNNKNDGLRTNHTVTEAGHNRVVFVNIDVGMGSDIVKRRVLDQLKLLFGAEMYTDDNVCISATHSHSGPGGFLQYALYHFTSGGLVLETIDAIVDGIVQAISQAHHALVPAKLYLSRGHLFNASINRSPTAYLNNPAEERDRYKHNVDTDVIQLNVFHKHMDAAVSKNEQESPLGILNFFAVHGTSMNNSNKLISGDNKGYAAYMMERMINGRDIFAGQGKFVAAFAQSNMGDVSPNTEGPRCIDTGEPCDLDSSTCGGKNQLCHGRGPGWRVGDVESTRIIGDLQFRKALELLGQRDTLLQGRIQSKVVYFNMSSTKASNDGSWITCMPAMGYSFAAGTTDGPGAFDFKQSDNGSSNGLGHLFWNLVGGAVLHPPSDEQKACHAPKPILLNTGEAQNHPYMWQPEIVDVQMMRIGRLFVVAVPAEFTTMAGRRLRDAVLRVLRSSQQPEEEEPIIVIAGPANTYSSYVTTFEEYQVQRYEGASTIFGPHTLDAYIQHYESLAKSFISSNPSLIEKGSPQSDFSERTYKLLPSVPVDVAPLLRKFGDVYEDVPDEDLKIVMPTTEGEWRSKTVRASFWAGHPRNGVEGGTFLTVDFRKSENDEWRVVRNDMDWDTRFRWRRSKVIPGSSIATVEWDIPEDVEVGEYRLHYYGTHKTVLGKQQSHEGRSKCFSVARRSESDK
ncbi:hypothetical protein HK102_003404 [Quaeritorhiza haematococci]|nr:hypothetical protein HK102_003404 [Quaeritorhiza haematococci]